MITTANYMIKAVVNNLTYLFQYEDSASVWEALQQFWYDDYPETPIIESGEMFPIDVIALDGGKVIRVYSFTFHPAAFHAFFDKGHIADGPYTLDQFANDIARKDKCTANLLREFMRKEMDIADIHDVVREIAWFLQNKRTLDKAKTSDGALGGEKIVAFHQKNYDRAMNDLEKVLIKHGIESIGVSDLNKA